MKGISRIISRIIDALASNGRNNIVSLDSDGLLERLANSNYKPEHWWEMHYQKGLRLCLVLSAVVMMITVILNYGIRYINDVILYENQLTINEQGAFNPRKSLNCEYALYLFNTADLWANSGILVNKKDRIRINISGGYNSWADGVVMASQNNTESLFSWISYDDTIRYNSFGIEHCISRGHSDFGFGDAMYAIVPESQNLHSDPLQLITEEQYNWWRLFVNEQKKENTWCGSMFLWKKDKSRKFHPAGRTGTLFFAVNDMYFDNNDTIEKFFNDSVSIDFYGQSFCKKAILLHKDNPEFDYQDNLGQLLVSIEIQRHVPYGLFRPMIVYRWLEYKVFETLDTYHNSLLGFSISLLWLVLFSIWITILFALYMIALLAIIYLLFLVGRWVLFLLDKVCFRIKPSSAK